MDPELERIRKEEIRKLVNARIDLYEYVKLAVLTQPGYVDGTHIKTICNTVQAFLNQSEKKILVLSMPPRHMKSTICSECLPAWYISNNLQREVIIASYNQSQARKMSRSCRQRFDTAIHKRIWSDVVFEVDAVDELQLQGKLNGRPNLIASGVGAGLTGSGADLIIIDDPVKDMEEAESTTIRDKVYDWYTSVASTRLSPKGHIIIVMTRWHHDDLAGRVLLNDEGNVQELNLPAIDEQGRALWSERYGIEALTSLKRSLGSRVFEALYQGRPTPLEGGLFKRQWFQMADKPFPPEARRCRYWDKAATAGGGDYTTGLLMAEWEGQYCVEDVIHVQLSAKDVRETIRATAHADGYETVVRMEQEGGSSGCEVIDLYSREVLQGFDFTGDHPTGPKEIRAHSLAAAMECGNVFIVKGQWNRDYIDELCEFPLGAHDDQVDASSGAFNQLARMGNEEIWTF